MRCVGHRRLDTAYIHRRHSGGVKALLETRNDFEIGEVFSSDIISLNEVLHGYSQVPAVGSSLANNFMFELAPTSMTHVQQ